MSFRMLAAALAVALGVTVAARADQSTLELGREFGEDFRQGRADVLWERMTPKMQEALGGSPDAIGQLRAELDEQAGAETRVLSEDTDEAEGQRLYVRIAEHEKGGVPIITQFAFDSEDRIAGFYVRPQQQPAESQFLDYQTKTPLRLPFDGEWNVYWGGRTPEQNYHVVDPGQRFAYDFNIVRDGVSYEGDPEDLKSY